MNKDRRELVEQKALAQVASEEREKRKQGKGGWWMKEGTGLEREIVRVGQLLIVSQRTRRNYWFVLDMMLLPPRGAKVRSRRQSKKSKRRSARRRRNHGPSLANAMLEVGRCRALENVHSVLLTGHKEADQRNAEGLDDVPALYIYLRPDCEEATRIHGDTFERIAPSDAGCDTLVIHKYTLDR